MKHFILTFLATVLCGTHHVACVESSQGGETSYYHVWNMSFIGTQPFVHIMNGVADEVSKCSFICPMLLCHLIVCFW